MEVPCITNLDLNCPKNCRLHFLALAKIKDLAAKLSIREGRVVTVAEAISAMRRMNAGEKIVHNSQNAQLLRDHGRLDECDNARFAPPPIGRDQ